MMKCLNEITNSKHQIPTKYRVKIHLNWNWEFVVWNFISICKDTFLSGVFAIC